MRIIVIHYCYLVEKGLISYPTFKTPIQNEIYSNWVKFYSSNESCKQVDKIKQILDILSQNENEKSKDIIKNHFANACKYEFLFWEKAYNLHV
jgi:thiaminase